MKINGIILAAGLSSRMKAFKPLLKLKEKTIIEYSIDSMFNAGVDQIVLVLGFRGEEVQNLLLNKYESSKLRFIYNENYAESDMLTSIKIGISALETCDTFYILPGDMPAIKAETFHKVKESMKGTSAMVAFPTVNGHKKHPPLISWRCIEPILNFHGDGGLRGLWNSLKDNIATVPVDDFGCSMDADTKEDYTNLVRFMGE